MLYVGQRVELVKTYDDRERNIAFEYGFELPQPGTVYTVRCVEGEHIRLAELVNPDVPYVDGVAEPLWIAERFRPVVERKTSIEIFTAMLNTKPARVDA